MIFEKWDILNEDGKPTGKTVLRGNSFFKQGEYHLVVHIWVVSDSGKILIQRRSDTKRLMPGEWAATGGAAISGENSFSAASRELAEELGIKSTEDTLKNLLRIKKRNSILDVWFLKSNIGISDLTLQKSEVAEAKWVTKDELISMIENGEFHNYGKEYFNKIFEKISLMNGAMV